MCGGAEEFIPQTQKKNIRIMKTGLLKGVQVLSTPQSRGEQPVRSCSFALSVSLPACVCGSVRTALLTPAARAVSPQNVQKLPAVELEKVFALEQHAMAQAADLRRLIGVGVTEEAQDLFDVLHKTLPCAWSGHTIIVGVVGQNEVIVTPPYTPESASGNDPKSLEHVRKVVRCPGPSPCHSIALAQLRAKREHPFACARLQLTGERTKLAR